MQSENELATLPAIPPEIPPARELSFDVLIIKARLGTATGRVQPAFSRHEEVGARLPGPDQTKQCPLGPFVRAGSISKFLPHQEKQFDDDNA